jgi:hypothetical protein
METICQYKYVGSIFMKISVRALTAQTRVLDSMCNVFALIILVVIFKKIYGAFVIF